MGERIWQRLLAGTDPSNVSGYTFVFGGMLFLAPHVPFTSVGNLYAALAYFSCSIASWCVCLVITEQRIATARELMMPHMARYAIEGLFGIAALQVVLPALLIGWSHRSGLEGAISFALQLCFAMSGLIFLRRGAQRAVASWAAIPLAAIAVLPLYAIAVRSGHNSYFIWPLAAVDVALASTMIRLYWHVPMLGNSAFPAFSTRYDAAIRAFEKVFMLNTDPTRIEQRGRFSAAAILHDIGSSSKVLTPVEALRRIIAQDFEEEARWRGIARGLWRRAPLMFSTVAMFIILGKLFEHPQYPNTYMIALTILNASTEELLAPISSFFRSDAGGREFAALLPGLGHGHAAKMAILKAALLPTVKAAVLDLICVNFLLLLVAIIYYDVMTWQLSIDILIYNAACFVFPGARSHIIVRIMSGLPESRVLFVSGYIALVASMGISLALSVNGYAIGASILATIAVIVAAALLVSFLSAWYAFQERQHPFLPVDQAK